MKRLGVDASSISPILTNATSEAALCASEVNVKSDRSAARKNLPDNAMPSHDTVMRSTVLVPVTFNSRIPMTLLNDSPFSRSSVYASMGLTLSENPSFLYLCSGMAINEAVPETQYELAPYTATNELPANAGPVNDALVVPAPFSMANAL